MDKIHIGGLNACQSIFSALAAFFVVCHGSYSTAQTIRLTSGTANYNGPRVDSGGRLLLYTGNNALYLHDLRKGSVTTVATGGVNQCWISGKKVLVFVSTGDHVGANADGNQEIFTYNIKGAATTQVTTTRGDTSEHVSIDRKGRQVVFLSDADLTGNNADNTPEVYRYLIRGQLFTQLTDTNNTEVVANPVINSKGKYVYFDSDADFTGQNRDGNREIFRRVLKTGDVEQLTDTMSGDNTEPSVSKNGSKIVFVSSSTDLSGANADGNDEVYYLDIKKALLARITNSAVDSSNPFISGNGNRILFSSMMDPFGQNPDNSEEIFFLFQKKNTILTGQLSTGGAGTTSHRAVLNDSGKSAFFVSDADLTGLGAGNSHVFRIQP